MNVLTIQITEMISSRQKQPKHQESRCSCNLTCRNVIFFLQVATVGYGDIAPQTPAEEGIAIFVFVLGIIFFGVLVGSLTQLLQSASKNARKASVYREKM